MNETNRDKLRQQLIGASLPLTVDAAGLRRDIRTDEAAADLAIAVFGTWYRQTYGIDLDSDFYVEDEPLEDVKAAWDRNEKHLTAPPEVS